MISAEGLKIRHIPGDDEVAIRNFNIPARDGYQIPMRSYLPLSLGKKDESRSYPVFVYYHGGGYTFGNIETGDENCRLICAGVGMSVINVDYRLAPKYPFPTGIEDSYDAHKWIAANSTEIQGDPSKGFVVGGVSAGGNFAGVIAYLARDDSISPPITGIFLSIPCCLMPQAFDLVPQWKNELLSVEQNKYSDMLDVRSYNQLIEGNFT